jgi:hypothetical protein
MAAVTTVVVAFLAMISANEMQFGFRALATTGWGLSAVLRLVRAAKGKEPIEPQSGIIEVASFIALGASFAV